MEESENLDQPSQEDIDTITDLKLSKKKYLFRIDSIKGFSKMFKGKEGMMVISNSRKERANNSVASIDSLIEYFDKFHRLKPSQVAFAKKLIKNAAILDQRNYERMRNNE